jgi:hypothetical protein
LDGIYETDHEPSVEPLGSGVGGGDGGGLEPSGSGVVGVSDGVGDGSGADGDADGWPCFLVWLGLAVTVAVAVPYAPGAWLTTVTVGAGWPGTVGDGCGVGALDGTPGAT